MVEKKFPAGWYPDPEGRANTVRYYDGEEWEETFAPAGSQPKPGSQGDDDNSSIIGVGVLFAILFPILGFIIGLTQINKKNGLFVVILSVIAGAAWWLIWSENQSPY